LNQPVSLERSQLLREYLVSDSANRLLDFIKALGATAEKHNNQDTPLVPRSG
jgi:hypothetical protein